MEDRVRALEVRFGSVDLKIAMLEQAVLTNTAVTKSIKEDTAELVTILKGSKVFAKVLSWAAGISASIAGVYALMKGWK
jgi:lysylphosphatidylglycerol synthetase-like protein (DUF2156 family)